MKKRINLLKANKRFVDREIIFLKIKNSLITLFFLLLLINITLYIFLLQQSQKIVLISNQKKELLDFFIQNKEADVKFAYFRNKEKQLNDILKEDVNFYPYYELLKGSLDNFAVGAKLHAVTIDKTKATNFTISFENYDNLISFLRFAESDDFLHNFNQLSLINFSKNDTQISKNDYRLNFKGLFINLN